MPIDRMWLMDDYQQWSYYALLREWIYLQADESAPMRDDRIAYVRDALCAKHWLREKPYVLLNFDESNR